MEAGLEGYIVDGSGRKTAVVIPIEEYESLLRGLQETASETTLVDSLLAPKELKATLSWDWSA